MTSRSAEFRAALRHVLPVVLAIVPFGAVYGAVAAKQGLSVLETVGFSMAVYAGSSQMVALQMMGLGSPVWAVVLSIFAINFRHVLYSASLGRHLSRFDALQKGLAFFLLVDPVFGDAEARAETHPLTRTFYFTYAITLYLAWQVFSLFGALTGRLVDDPRAFGLDFVLPVYFLALLMAFRSRGDFLPVALSSGVAAIAIYLTLGSPWHVTLGPFAGILYAAVAAPAKTEGATR